MTEKLNELLTEWRNPDTENLDALPTSEIVKKLNEEDKKVALAVEQELESVTKAVDLIVESFENGGRLFYFGAGTSGRLGMLDAAECPPTFGTEPSLVQGVIAGGMSALVEAIEGAEDEPELGREDVEKVGVCARDVVVGIAASGRTPYVLGALEEARKRGAKTVALSCNPGSALGALVDVDIAPVVGPEVVTGSTRLKAGTAQKMVLNMLTTASMVRMGKVYGNLMVNVQATNGKLEERVKKIIVDATDCTYAEATELAEQAQGDARVGILMKLKGISAEEACKQLDQVGGRIREALEKK
ncbi:N-acetylmuramic acid 6-phosphate etherase [Ammoniphilus sp. CFH 90114]|uniref:N-acetylmuramic acid 6-phosphate etherase n=1 Tax=Ammoniphilus sp. CFH 90114 TaxID=2493665 RepID=UPI00100F70EE|nr:N-acetylmuramic acid 6-phosphate etherase [Ammoniphilus sp. CFH 90114]RXT04365.1 N-acetylmuramic acid 6-phosphate etherase [Ammoniphilus sp. CFH 90114]